MIIIQLSGGLGNQMFEYAFARSLSIQLNARLILDTRFYDIISEAITPRKFELSYFTIQADILSDDLIRQISDELVLYEEETMFKYDDEFDNIELPCYLTGCWQSWKYFENIIPQIQSEFSFKKEMLSESAINTGKFLSGSPSVSIHIRRTDYLKYDFIDVLSLQYYVNAVQYLSSRMHRLAYYIFTDDPDWVKQNLEIPVVFQLIEGHTSIEDMYLMSCCRYQIIANSTYSWWAAWLNTFSKKIVIAPQKWKFGKDMDVSNTDLIPPSWVCL